MSISETKERSMVPYVSAKWLVVAIHYIIRNALAVSLKKLAEYRVAKLYYCPRNQWDRITSLDHVTQLEVNIIIGL